MTPVRTELLWEYRFAFGYEKTGPHRARPSRSQRDTASPAELAGRDFPDPLAGLAQCRQQMPGWLSAPCVTHARPESSKREAHR